METKITGYTGKPYIIYIGMAASFMDIAKAIGEAQAEIVNLEKDVSLNHLWVDEAKPVLDEYINLVDRIQVDTYYDGELQKSSNHKEKWERGLRNNQKKFRAKTNRKKAKRKRGKK